jgi:hypothetical protein
VPVFARKQFIHKKLIQNEGSFLGRPAIYTTIIIKLFFKHEKNILKH